VVFGQLAGIGLGENLVLNEALDEDVSRSAFGNGAVILCQSSISSRRLASSSSRGTASSKGVSTRVSMTPETAWSCTEGGATLLWVPASDIGDWSWSVTGLDSGESGIFSGLSGMDLCREKRLGGS